MQIRKRANECPLFVYPLPRDEGIEFFLAQWTGNQCAFTSLVEYVAPHYHLVFCGDFFVCVFFLGWFVGPCTPCPYSITTPTPCPYSITTPTPCVFVGVEWSWAFTMQLASTAAHAVRVQTKCDCITTDHHVCRTWGYDLVGTHRSTMRACVCWEGGVLGPRGNFLVSTRNLFKYRPALPAASLNYLNRFGVPLNYPLNTARVSTSTLLLF